MKRFFANVATCAVAAALLSTAAQASTVGNGSYVLRNHPDGSAQPPQYGARFDELYNATAGHDIFTFDFNAPGSLMVITIDATSIRIQGRAMGGRDTGSGYAADVYNGLYTFDMLYNLGVQSVPGDDDTWVNAASNHVNFGSINTPLGDSIAIVDERGNFGYSLRIGDEDNDLGHRGYTGASGWGWLAFANPISHTDSQDWLFTVGDRLIPTPGSAALISLGALAAMRRRRV